MNADNKPWLFLKRVNHWNPLANVRELSAPAAYLADPPSPGDAKTS
jgi:hypothetical protein